MLPIFKTHSSIGKSILTFDLPDDCSGYQKSIFSYGLKDICLVEDNLSQLPIVFRNAETLDVNIFFGLRISICNDIKDFSKDNDTSSKIILFAKNKDGMKLLNKIFSFSRENEHEVIDNKFLEKTFDKDLLKLAVPFYDSFLHRNNFSFAFCVPPELNKLDVPIFFVEDNCLSYDGLLKSVVIDYCKKNSFDYLETKSIYYNSREDINSFTAYKLLTNRKWGSTSLDKPNLDHFSSTEFCWESFQDANK